MENKTVLITGTSTGLGNSLANHYSASGYHVIGLSRTAIDLPNYTHYAVDISNRTALAIAFDTIKSNHSLDLLINNAGVFALRKFSDTSFDEIDGMIDLNLKGAMYVTKHCLDIMSEGSKIIFINSVAGLAELDNQSVYCSSKFGLTAFAGVLGKELQSRRIKVTSIHPGGINTTLWNDSNPYPAGEVSDAMDPQAVVNMIDHIVTSKYNVDYKTVKMFPSIEWHN